MGQEIKNWFNKNKYLALGIIFLIAVVAVIISVIYYFQVSDQPIYTPAIVHKTRSIPQNQPSESTNNQNLTDDLYFGKWVEGKYFLVGLQSGRKKEFIPTGYGIVDMEMYQMFPTFLILHKDNNLYSYNIEDKIINSIFLDQNLLLKSNENVWIFPSITEKNKFLIRIDTLDLSKVSEYDGSSPVLGSRSYSFDASINKLMTIDSRKIDYSCIRYDSRNQRLFTWSCGAGSVMPIFVSNLDGTDEKEIVSTTELGLRGNDRGRVNYNNGLFFAQTNTDLKILVLDPKNSNPTKEVYTVSESVKSQLSKTYPYSSTIDKSKKTIAIGGDDYILLLRFNSDRRVTQSKYIPAGAYVNYIFSYDGKLYYQHGTDINVTDLGNWQLEKTIPSPGHFGEITLFAD